MIGLLILGLIIAALIVLKVYLKLTCGHYTITTDLSGKTVIVTGASSGIGIETAVELARKGARVYLACRNVEKAKPIAQEIKNSSGNAQVFVMQLDLAKLSSVRQFAKDFLDKEKRLDILINNAGMAGKPGNKPELTEDNIEITMQSNHFGHFLLTNLLLDRLKQSAPSRVVNVSSMIHTWAQIDVNNPPIFQKGEKYKPLQAYACSKLANVWFTRGLASRLHDTGVTTTSLHPGVIVSEFNRDLPSVVQTAIQYIGGQFMKTPQQGAQTTLYCATAPELTHVNGAYFQDCKPKASSLLSLDDELVEKFWKHSEKLVGL